MLSASIPEVEDRYLARTYQRYPVVVVRGYGATLWDAEGKAYIDCMGGYGVALVGHCHPHVVAAVKRQLEKLITCHCSLYNDARAYFLEKFSRVLPWRHGRVFLCNSGAEAVECALKLARRYTGRPGVVAMMRGYHGKTMGALSATWSEKYRKPFQPLLPHFSFVPYGKVDAVKEALTDEVGAVIVEPIQGESGVIIPPDEYLKELRELCDSRDVLLICDEIQCGLGRTGRFWASEHWGVVPDIICAAKGLAGGIPMGVAAARADIMEALKLGEHTSTFGGNPLACSAASAVIDVLLGERLPERARKLGEKFLELLREAVEGLPSVREVRGLGLMLAIELRRHVRGPLMKCLKDGVIALYSGMNVIRLLPPLVIEEEQVEKAAQVIGSALMAED